MIENEDDALRRERGRDLLRAMKCTDDPPTIVRSSKPAAVALRPVAAVYGLQVPADVERLTSWRNQHVNTFLDIFEATPQRTSRWLHDVVARDDGRIVFMIEDTTGRTFGYCGLAHIDWSAGSFELDGVVRGLEGPPGGMTHALLALLGWAVGELGLSPPLVRVRSDNPRAVAFYRSLGFAAERSEPLVSVTLPDMTRWIESSSAPDAAPHLIHMVRRAGHLIEADES